MKKVLAGIWGLTIVVGVAIAVYTQVNAPVREGIDKSIETGLAAPEIVETQRGNQEAPLETFGQPRARVEELPGTGGGDDGDDRTFAEKLKDKLKKELDKLKDALGVEKLRAFMGKLKVFLGNEVDKLKESIESSFAILLDQVKEVLPKTEQEAKEKGLEIVVSWIEKEFGRKMPNGDPDPANKVEVYQGPGGTTIASITKNGVTVDYKVDLSIDATKIGDGTDRWFKSVGLGAIVKAANGIFETGFGILCMPDRTTGGVVIRWNF